jgi:hypothetical protein
VPLSRWQRVRMSGAGSRLMLPPCRTTQLHSSPLPTVRASVGFCLLATSDAAPQRISRPSASASGASLGQRGSAGGGASRARRARRTFLLPARRLLQCPLASAARFAQRARAALNELHPSCSRQIERPAEAQGPFSACGPRETGGVPAPPANISRTARRQQQPNFCVRAQSRSPS